MGKLDTTIRVIDSADRPCLVKATPNARKAGEKALFIKWTESPSRFNDALKRIMALVEFEDGSVGTVMPEMIKFLDSKERFADIAWDEN